MIRQPKILAMNVGHGNEFCCAFEKIELKKYRATLPKAPPMATKSIFFIIVLN